MNEMSIKKSGNTVEELKELVKNFKAHAMTLSSAAGAGHVGGAMSSAEWLIASWFDKLDMNPDSNKRDRFFIEPWAHYSRYSSIIIYVRSLQQGRNSFISSLC